MKVIAVANQKGGVGKTTTSLNLAAQLASMGKVVLALDLDPQGNLSTFLLDGEVEFPFERSVSCLFDKPKTADINTCLHQATVDGVPIEGLKLIPSDISLSAVIETSMTKIHRERILKRHLEKLNGFDIVILDCPPNLGLTTLNAMLVADLILTPIDMGAAAVKGVRDLIVALHEVTEEKAPLHFVLRNERNGSETVMNEFIDQELAELRDTLGVPFITRTVRKTANIGKANVMARPILFFQKSDLVNKDYLHVAKELLNAFNCITNEVHGG